VEKMLPEIPDASILQRPGNLGKGVTFVKSLRKYGN